jgi:hypothetical protein
MEKNLTRIGGACHQPAIFFQKKGSLIGDGLFSIQGGNLCQQLSLPLLFF